MYDIADSPNFENYKSCKVFLSEPCKFIATSILIFVGMLIYYVCTASYLANYPALIVLTILSQIGVIAIVICLAFRDPGIIQKILPEYEDP